MRKIKQTKAERIADLIGYDVFLRAEAYYYESGILKENNFIKSLEDYGCGAISLGFFWHKTLEGHEFWYDIYFLIRKWEREKMNWAKDY